QEFFMFYTMSLCGIEEECHDRLTRESLFHLIRSFYLNDLRTCGCHRLVEEIAVALLHYYFRAGAGKIRDQLYLFLVGARDGSGSAQKDRAGCSRGYHGCLYLQRRRDLRSYLVLQFEHVGKVMSRRIDRFQHFGL